jgi:4-aminobutyrate aminotransferase/(S)-3-amino-2-methylpropionate transaminase
MKFYPHLIDQHNENLVVNVTPIRKSGAIAGTVSNFQKMEQFEHSAQQIETIMKEKPWDRAAELGKYWMNGLRKLQRKYAIIGDVKGKGVMIGVELVKDRKTKEPAKEESVKLKKEAGKRGLILPAGQGWFGNTIRMVPSVVMAKDQIDQALHIMDESFEAISKQV